MSRVIDVYMVGDSPEDAEGYEPYLYLSEARDYAEGTGGRVYRARATLDFTDMKRVREDAIR